MKKRAALGALLVWGLFAATALGQSFFYPGRTGNPPFVYFGPGSGAGGPPPPVCSKKLDFSNACNSQYLEAVGL